MNKWLASTQIIQTITKNLLESKQQYYSEQIISYKIQQYPHLTFKHIVLKNNYNQKLYGMLIRNKKNKNNHCIVFMHGLASNILEGTILIGHLPENVDLFCFDFSGSGKSQGKVNTYGYKEHEDIENVIKILDRQKYTKYVLWGRSMGAVACLLHSIITKYRDKILLQILDSPFNSFQSICQHNASHNMNIPELFIPTAINILKESFSTHPFNPFNIKITESISDCCIPSIFVYSRSDGVVPCQNSQEIIRNLNSQCHYQKFIICQNHNETRTTQTLTLIFQKIQKYILHDERGWNKLQKKKAIGVYSRFLKRTNEQCLENNTTNESYNNRRAQSFHKNATHVSLGKKIGIISPIYQKTKKEVVNQIEKQIISRYKKQIVK